MKARFFLDFFLDVSVQLLYIYKTLHIHWSLLNITTLRAVNSNEAKVRQRHSMTQAEWYLLCLLFNGGLYIRNHELEPIQKLDLMCIRQACINCEQNHTKHP